MLPGRPRGKSGANPALTRNGEHGPYRPYDRASPIALGR